MAYQKYMAKLKPSKLALPPRKRYKTVEHDNQTEIVKRLIWDNFLVIRINGGAQKSENRFIRCYTIENYKTSSGLSDLIIAKNGQTAFVEIKKDAKQPLRDSQKDFQELCIENNIPYIKTHSYENLIEQIKEKKLFLK